MTGRRGWTVAAWAVIVLGLAGLALVAVGVSTRVPLVGFKTYYTPSGAMVPTIEKNDVLLANTLIYHTHQPADGDIVILYPPIETRQPFLKRIVARPGESFRIRRGIAYRNGTRLDEPYAGGPAEYDLDIQNYTIVADGKPLDPQNANIPPRSLWTAPDTVPPNCSIVFGDNRNNSEDSHIWGFAQSGGTFYAGSEAGQPAPTMEEIVARIYPFARTRSFP